MSKRKQARKQKWLDKIHYKRLKRQAKSNAKNRPQDLDKPFQKKFNQNRHHNFAKSRGGTWERSNIIWLDVDFHNWIHKRFGNKTLREIIEILERLDRAKSSQSDGDIIAEKYCERFNT